MFPTFHAVHYSNNLLLIDYVQTFINALFLYTI